MSGSALLSEAERRAEWRRGLQDRGLVEKKITIRAVDKKLFGEIAARTRNGDSLGDILFELASKAAPPPADLPPEISGVLPARSSAADVEIRFQPEPWRVGVIRATPWQAKSAFAVREITFPPRAADAPVLATSPVETGPVETGPAETGVADVLELDAPVAAEPQPALSPASLPSGGPLPASWREASRDGSVRRLRRTLSTFAATASRNISPRQFFVVAVAIALFVASVVIYALRTPTVEAGPLHEASLGREAANDELSRAVGLLEAENRRLADHLEALLLELDAVRSARKADAVRAAPVRAGRKAPKR